jgi:hypothetical protein
VEKKRDSGRNTREKAQLQMHEMEKIHIKVCLSVNFFVFSFLLFTQTDEISKMQLRKQQLFNVEVINNKNVDKLQS